MVSTHGQQLVSLRQGFEQLNRRHRGLARRFETQLAEMKKEIAALKPVASTIVAKSEEDCECQFFDMSVADGLQEEGVEETVAADKLADEVEETTTVPDGWRTQLEEMETRCDSKMAAIEQYVFDKLADVERQLQSDLTRGSCSAFDFDIEAVDSVCGIRLQGMDAGLCAKIDAADERFRNKFSELELLLKNVVPFVNSIISECEFEARLAQLESRRADLYLDHLQQMLESETMWTQRLTAFESGCATLVGQLATDAVREAEEAVRPVLDKFQHAMALRNEMGVSRGMQTDVPADARVAQGKKSAASGELQQRLERRACVAELVFENVPCESSAHARAVDSDI